MFDILSLLPIHFVSIQYNIIFYINFMVVTKGSGRHWKGSRSRRIINEVEKNNTVFYWLPAIWLESTNLWCRFLMFDIYSAGRCCCCCCCRLERAFSCIKMTPQEFIFHNNLYDFLNLRHKKQTSPFRWWWKLSYARRKMRKPQNQLQTAKDTRRRNYVRGFFP